MRAPFIYSDKLARYKFTDDHPLRQERLRLTFELCRKYGLLEDEDVVNPKDATKKDLLLAHSSSYVDAVEAISEGSFSENPTIYGLGTPDNPTFKSMFKAALEYIGATLESLNFVNKEKRCFVISGGMHHAKWDRASGFCIFNDVSILIRKLLRRFSRIAYIDIDAHHSDGVQEAFYDTDEVLTISLHESGFFLFPGTGFQNEIGKGKGIGYSVNLPLPPFTTDNMYLEAFREIVPPLIRKYKPQVLISQLGVDTHFKDPLTNMNLTVQGFAKVVGAILKLSSRWIALGGGGYDIDVVARAWTLAYAQMKGKPLIEELYDEFSPAESEKVRFKVYKALRELKEVNPLFDF
ncbi:MAG: acetoin utilization protein AcuC [Candidatus Methanofastidiosia archaeon]